MADYAALQEQNKLAALRAMAAGNPDPYAGSSSVISGAQDEALSRYAGDAVGRSAPQGSVDQGKAMISGPGDNTLAGLGMSSDAYAKQLAAMHEEAAHAAAPSGTGGSSTSTKQGDGYNQYGGYKTSAEYENAVLGRATQMEADRAAEVEGQRVAFENASTEGSIGAVKALQAKNEAVVGGPGAVIHGIGYVPTNPNPPPAAASTAVTQAAKQGRLAGAVPAAPTTSWVPPRPGTGETSNYTPEQVAMYRAASDQAYAEHPAASIWQPASAPGHMGENNQWVPSGSAYLPRGAEAVGNAFAPQEDAIADPRNMYEFAQRAAINELGGDPYEAIGRFSPDWAMKTYALPGAKDPLDYQAAQNEALERQGNEAAGLGAYTDSEIKSRQENVVRQSPDYQTGLEVVKTQQEALASGPNPDQPITLDALRAALAQNGVEATAANQIIADYGRLYPGQAYFNLPQDVSTAGAQSGNLNG